MRPTKKQKSILNFIKEFIETYGYSPSYREIMKGLNYSSIATISLHINSLIARGFLTKRDRSARSLEIVQGDPGFVVHQQESNDTAWLKNRINQTFEFKKPLTNLEIENIKITIYTLKMLQLEELASYLNNKLIKNNTTE